MASAIDPRPGEESLAETLALCALAVGDRAVVDHVDPDGPVSARLLDLGFVPGTEVALVRRAPRGDPAVYELRGTRFCLRDRDASRIRVRPL